VSAPELLGDLAAVFLARTWHNQGADMPDQIDIDEEAQRLHAAACRKYNPNVTDMRIASYWEGIGDVGRAGYRRYAERRLTEEATR